MGLPRPGVGPQPDDGRLGEFATIMDKLTGNREFPQWIERAKADELSGLRSFINGVRTDLDAVTKRAEPAVQLRRVEGYDNRIKMTKRQMHSGANFDLLRRSIVHRSDLPITDLPEPNCLIIHTATYPNRPTCRIVIEFLAAGVIPFSGRSVNLAHLLDG